MPGREFPKRGAVHRHNITLICETGMRREPNPIARHAPFNSQAVTSEKDKMPSRSHAEMHATMESHASNRCAADARHCRANRHLSALCQVHQFPSSYVLISVVLGGSTMRRSNGLSITAVSRAVIDNVDSSFFRLIPSLLAKRCDISAGATYVNSERCDRWIVIDERFRSSHYRAWQNDGALDYGRNCIEPRAGEHA
jgi:hypothetical protein